MRTALIAVTVSALTAVATVAAMTASDAATGTGSYAAWTTSGTSGTATFAGTYFTDATAERTNGSWDTPSGSSTWLSAQTPFGAEYGSSQGKGYLNVALPLGGTTTSNTITFATEPTAGTWAFALGDVDAENVTITATAANGSSLDVSSWFQAGFNYCNVSPKPSSCPAGTHTDVPTWASPVITGSGSDTYGAAAWFKPTAAVKTLTFSQARNVAGAPVYQLWIAADIQSSPAPSSSSASPSPSSSASASASASPSATPSAAAADCTSAVTHLVNGGFEEPAIPAKAFRQLKDSLVPGWNTTATDKLIEIWSDGYQGVKAPVGSQFAEINATQASELYQDVETVPGEELTWSLYHRARGAGAAGDTMSVNIGVPGSAPDEKTTFNDKLAEGWVLHTGTYVVPAGQTSTRFGFESGPTASGSKSVGNFLDNIFFTRSECLPAAATAEPSASPSPTASPSATDTPAPTPTSGGGDTVDVVTPGTEPPADKEVTPNGNKPVIVDPNGPTILDPIADSDADPDSTITAIEEPQHGTASVEGDTVVYTPDEGFRGQDEVIVFVTEPTDTVLRVDYSLKTGRDQLPLAPLGLPKAIAPGTTVLVDHAVATNAGQYAKVTAACLPILRTKATGDVRPCAVTRSGAIVSVHVLGNEPVGVRVSVSAPAKGRYGPYLKVRDYLVRPKG